jgi:hypothetical protein
MSAIGLGGRLRLLAIIVCLAIVGGGAASEDKESDWKAKFSVNKDNLVSTGKNPYFVLEPGYVARFQGGGETLTITVLDETKLIDGVKTRVVEEREEKDGKLVEVSRNYFAIDKTTNDVYYFGEEVDIYKDGKVVDHEGGWLSGIDGATFGMMMPGAPKIGDKFYQELAPKVAMDRCEIVAIEGEFQTPAGTFKNCLRVRDTTPLEKGSSDKVYAPGVGLIKDDACLLTKAGKP